MMRLFIILTLLLGSSLLGFSQEIGEVTRNGELFKKHAVEAGNTLYGLHVKYEVPIEAILEANPTAEEGLQVGQIIYIPVAKSEPKTQKKEEYKIHVVKRKETLYGISKMYDVKVADIIKANPGADAGIKIRQELKIPLLTEVKQKRNEDTESGKKEVGPEPKAKQDSIRLKEFEVKFKDSVVDYTVEKGETLYSISRRFMLPVEKLVEYNNLDGNSIKPGQKLRIPLKKERIEKVQVRNLVTLDSVSNKTRGNVKLVEKQDKYKVLVALPLKVNLNSEAISGMFSENTSLHKLTNLSVEFLMGAQMALDSLKQLGLNAEVEFYDTEGKLNGFKEKLSNRNANEWDLIIGPFYPQLLEYASQWAKMNETPVVAVTKINTELLKNNPYLLSVVPSELTMIGAMAKYLAIEHGDDNIVIIEGENAEVKDKVNYFRSVFEKNLNDSLNNRVKQVTIGNGSGRTLMAHIEPKASNFIVCLSTDVKQVMRFVNALNAAKNYSPTYGRADVSMVGLQSWLDMSALNSYYKNRFEFHFASSNYLNYNKKDVIEFVKTYRSRYGSDPSKYAFHGFDVTLSQLSNLLLGYDRNTGLMDYFNVQSLGHNRGHENVSVFISKQKEFEIELIRIISNTNHF